MVAKEKRMSSQTDVIAEALKAVLAEPAPNSRDALLDELRKHERLIRQTIDRGWTPTRLASRLKAAGVKGPTDRIRDAVAQIAGVPPTRPRKDQQQKKPPVAE